MLRLEILPNLVPLLVTLLAVEMGIAVLVEAILSFVGLSVAGDTPTWGGMIAEGRQIDLPGAVDHGAADRLHHRRPCSASTCSATACAPRSIRCSGDDRRCSRSQDLHVAIASAPRPPTSCAASASRSQPGEVRGLVGESGAGKSMIGRAMFGLLPADARITRGRIPFEGRDLLAHAAKRERRGLLGRRIALIPQDPMTSLNPVKRVGEQIGAVLRHHLGCRGGRRGRAPSNSWPRSRSATRSACRRSIRTKSPAACASAS